MATGRVKWYNPEKGYGFITPDENGSDVFVHVKALEASAITLLNDGQRVSYELTEHKGRMSATNITILD